MYMKFSVPEFPIFRNNLASEDYRRYVDHMKRFESYAAYVIKMQVDAAGKAVEKGYLKDELADLKEVIAGVNAAAVHCVEKSAVIVETELEQVRKKIGEEVERLQREPHECRPIVEFQEFEPRVITNAAAPSLRGRNWERNVRDREIRKLRKQARQASGIDWRKGGAAGAIKIPTGVNQPARFRGEQATQSRGKKVMSSDAKVEPSTDLPSRVEIVDLGSTNASERVEEGVTGFWNSCSPQVRQELIDSKARMHIAENNKKTKEAEERVNYLESPQAIMDKVIRLAKVAEENAKEVGENRILGWARTIATSSAESLARSAPSSVPSFDDQVNEEARATESKLAEELESEKARLARVVAENITLRAKLAKKTGVTENINTYKDRVYPVRLGTESQASFFARITAFRRRTTEILEEQANSPGYQDEY